jgi:Phytanoyl-CoA dioxygenase (PhyH)
MDEPATLKTDGLVRLPNVLESDLESWLQMTQPFFDLQKPGYRIASSVDLAELIEKLLHNREVERVIGSGWRCVRAIAFNKSPQSNWALGWHQDRTIAVERRAVADGFTVWSMKSGTPHVEPPFSLLERMVTVRVHLDPVPQDNAPLLAAKGSHRLGKLEEAKVQTVAEASEIVTCLAEAGDVWVYATPIVHASARSEALGDRRVIHLDFSRHELPEPLEWAGIA